jgi:uncharacterized membrane protein (DUF4010 family)
LEGLPNVGLMVPIYNVLAYLIGPATLAEPPWVTVGATVAAVLLLTVREKLHGFARHVETGEIVKAGKFLILTGLVFCSFDRRSTLICRAPDRMTVPSA